MTPKYRQQNKIRQVGLQKLKSFCIEKETVNKVKRQIQNGRKYLQTLYLTRVDMQNI